MMSIRKAETITGYRIYTLRHPRYPNRIAAIAETESGQAAWVATGKDENEALCRLVDDVYQLHSHIAMERQGWRCKQCGKFKPLSAHHVVKRSKGRYDGIDNLEGLCAECHRGKHGQ